MSPATASLGSDITLGDLFDDAVDVPWDENSGDVKVEPHTPYQRDVIGWARDMLGLDERKLRWSMFQFYAEHEWDGTPDPFAAAAQALEHFDANGIRAIGVESGTTTGKTYFAAVVVLWFLACFEDSTVITVAPKEDQLRLHVWKEITRLWPRFHHRFPTAKKDTLRIQMRAGSDVWAAHGFVAGVSAGEVEGSASKAQGFHAEHMLIVFEETPGIAPAIIEAFKQTCRAPHNLRIAFGNPNNQLDALHTLCVAPGSAHITISALDHPNVVGDDHRLIAGAVSRVGIQSAKDEDGEDSPMYLSRVRGQSPAQASDALIHLAWLQACVIDKTNPDHIERAILLSSGPKALGVDVANSENGDKAAVSSWQGATCVKVVAKPCPSATDLGREVWRVMEREGIDPGHVGVDPIGVGAATVNYLDEQCDAKFAQRIVRCNAGFRPVLATTRAPDGTLNEWIGDANRFRNLRAQMYWQFREDARLGKIVLPNDPNLFRQLVVVRFETDHAGVVTIEPKADIKKRMGGKSPDEADALVMGNWVRARAAEPSKPPTGEDIAPARETLVVRRSTPARHTTPRPAFNAWRP